MGRTLAKSPPIYVCHFIQGLLDQARAPSDRDTLRTTGALCRRSFGSERLQYATVWSDKTGTSPVVHVTAMMDIVCVHEFIQFHITEQPGPVIPIFQCYKNGSFTTTTPT